MHSTTRFRMGARSLSDLGVLLSIPLVVRCFLLHGSWTRLHDLAQPKERGVGPCLWRPFIMDLLHNVLLWRRRYANSRMDPMPPRLLVGSLESNMGTVQPVCLCLPALRELARTPQSLYPCRSIKPICGNAVAGYRETGLFAGPIPQ